MNQLVRSTSFSPYRILLLPLSLPYSVVLCSSDSPAKSILVARHTGPPLITRPLYVILIPLSPCPTSVHPERKIGQRKMIQTTIRKSLEGRWVVRPRLLNQQPAAPLPQHGPNVSCSSAPRLCVSATRDMMGLCASNIYP